MFCTDNSDDCTGDYHVIRMQIDFRTIPLQQREKPHGAFGSNRVLFW